MSDPELPACGYLSHFLMVQAPFASPIDPSSQGGFFAGAGRESARRALGHGVRDRRGASLLVGGVGHGKSSLLDRLARDLEPSTFVVRIDQPPSSPQELVASLLEALDGSPPTLHALNDLLRHLQEELGGVLARGFSVAVLVDDAQEWDVGVLGTWGRLLDLPAHVRQGLQLVLAGTPELLERLESVRCRDLTRRLGVRRELRPLRREETRRFVAERLEIAGADPEFFEDDAHHRAYDISGGVLGEICRVCDAALRSAHRAGRPFVNAQDFESVSDASSLAGSMASLEEIERSAPRQRRWLVAASVGAVALVVGGLVGGLVSRRGESPLDSAVAAGALKREPLAETGPGGSGLSGGSSGAEDIAARFASLVRETEGGERVIRVVRGATVYDLMLEVYGRYSLDLLGAVRRSNPWLEDADLILPGQLLRFPPDRRPDRIAGDSERSDGPRSSY